MPSVVLTGATSGVGLQAAKALAEQGYDLILPVRSPEKRQSVKEELIQAGAPNAALVDCDLASLRCVADAADEIRELTAAQFGAPIALVMNAGIYPTSGLKFSIDGFEQTIAVNVLAHFLLYQELVATLPLGSRVVMVGSEAHRNKEGWLGRSGPDCEQPAAVINAIPETLKDLGRWARHASVRYATSKLFCIQLAYEINRRGHSEGISGVAFDPGPVANTNISRYYPRAVRTAYNVAAPVLEFAGTTRSVEEAGRDLAKIAVSADARHLAGKYFSNGSQTISSPESYDMLQAEALWRACTRATSPFLSEAARRAN